MIRKYIERIARKAFCEMPVLSTDYGTEIRHLNDKISELQKKIHTLEDKTTIRVYSDDMRSATGRDCEYLPIGYVINQLIKTLGYEYMYRTESIELKSTKKDG